MQPLPDARLLPVTQSSPTGDAGAAAPLDRQQLPRQVRLQDKDDARQAGPVRNPGTTALGLGRLGWEQGATIAQSSSETNGLLMVKYLL